MNAAIWPSHTKIIHLIFLIFPLNNLIINHRNHYKMLTVIFHSLFILSNGAGFDGLLTSCGLICQFFHARQLPTTFPCGVFEQIPVTSVFYYHNNLWGLDTANGTNYQCLNGTTVTYLWFNGPSNLPTVKAYPAFVTGWHFGLPYTQGVGNIPVKVSLRSTIMVNWSVTHTNTGGGFEWWNTAFDCWLGATPNPTFPSVEIMIWMNRVIMSPIGVFMGYVTVWGNVTFQFYNYAVPTQAWPTYSFLQNVSTWNFTNVDIYPFFDYLLTNSFIKSDHYIISIQAGNEIVIGQGSFTHNYSIKVN